MGPTATVAGDEQEERASAEFGLKSPRSWIEASPKGPRREADAEPMRRMMSSWLTT